jgi:hypothetical protein
MLNWACSFQTFCLIGLTVEPLIRLYRRKLNLIFQGGIVTIEHRSPLQRMVISYSQIWRNSTSFIIWQQVIQFSNIPQQKLQELSFQRALWNSWWGFSSTVTVKVGFTVFIQLERFFETRPNCNLFWARFIQPRYNWVTTDLFGTPELWFIWSFHAL